MGAPEQSDEPDVEQLALGFDDVVEIAASLEARARCRAVVHWICRQCGHEARAWWSCDARCERCSARAGARARSLRRLLPNVPLRHWVLTLPEADRVRLARSDKDVGELVKAFVDEIFAVYRQDSAPTPSAEIHCGAAVVVHRFGAALDHNLHVHVVALDGVYRIDERGAVFHARGRSPSRAELQRVVREATAKVPGGATRAPARREASPTHEPVRRVRVERASGPAADPAPRGPPEPSGPAEPSASQRSAAATTEGAARASKVVANGVGVYAGAAVDPADRGHVCRLAAYVTRPEVKAAEFQPTEGGRVRYRLHRAAPDGATHVELTPSAAVARLLPLARPGRVGRTSYHGVLAPAAAERWRILPTQLRLAPELVEVERRAKRARAPRGGDDRRATPASNAPRCPACGAALTLSSVEEHTAGGCVTTADGREHGAGPDASANSPRSFLQQSDVRGRHGR